jgi:hypothetical protein
VVRSVKGALGVASSRSLSSALHRLVASDALLTALRAAIKTISSL